MFERIVRPSEWKWCSPQFPTPEEGLPQNLAVPLDPISAGANEGWYALLGPFAVGRHAPGGKSLDPRSGRFHAPDQEIG